MKPHFFENLEEKFYFKTSHFFWHLLTAIGGLALVGGVLLLMWGLTPSLKPGVSKAAYPEPVAVTAEEILQKIQPVKSSLEVASKTLETGALPATSETKTDLTQTIDPTEVAFNAAMDSLKALLPAEKFRWKDRGHWETDWYDRRRWVVDARGIESQLKSLFRNVDAESHSSKTQTVEAFSALLALFPLEQRYTVYKAALSFSKDNVATTAYNMSLLRNAVPNYSSDKADFIETLSTFGQKNPRDGQTFIDYTNTIIQQFPKEHRREILAVLVQCYYTYFDNIQKQKEATGYFLPLLSNFAPELQAKALNEFYDQWVNKNRDRENRIQEIDYAYQLELRHAEEVVAGKRLEKAANRTRGLQLIGGSVVFIAFVALFLVLLSIQRHVRALREVTESGS